MTTASRIRAIIVALLAAFLLVAIPQPALAVTSSELRTQLDEANEKLDSLANEVMAAGEALNDTIFKLEETQEKVDAKQDEIDAKQEEIDAKQAEIDAKQDEIDETQAKIEATERRIQIKLNQLAATQEALSERMVATYKAGPTSLLQIILGSSSFEELQSNIFYAQKVRAQDEQRIEDVRRARAELEEEQEVLEQQKGELEKQQAELEKQQDELKRQQDALEAQQAELLELKAEQQALADEQASQKADLEKRQAEQKAYVDQLDSELKAKIEEERKAELERQRQEAARLAEQYGGTGPVQVTDANRQTILNAAYTQLGVSYVWGGYSPGVCFDCSGFTKWCYAQAGITLPHSAYGQSRLLSPRAEADLEPGDLVVWIGGMNPISGNHVAIYIGDNKIIHAVGRGVIIGGLYSVGGYTVAGAVV